MKTRNIILVLAAIAVIFWAWKTTQDKAPTTALTTKRIFPDLLDRLNDVRTLQIASAGKTTELTKQDESWVISNRDNFPAEFASVKSALINLASATVIEEKTSKPEKYARLGVAGKDGEDSDSILIDVLDENNSELAALIVGSERTAQNLTAPQYYVRKPTDAVALLVAGEVDVSEDPLNWMDTKIGDIPAERVRQVSINRNQETPIVVQKAQRSDNFFTLQAIPTGFVPASRAVVSSFGAILRDVKFDDVAAASKVEGLTPRAIAEVQTFDGLVATLEQFDVKEKVLIKFNFAFNPDLVVSAPETPDAGSTAQGTNGEPQSEVEAPPKPSIEEVAAELNAKVSGWVYALPDYKIRLIDKRFDDLIKTPEPEKTDAAADTQAE